MAFSPDGRTLAVGGWSELCLWEIASRQERQRFPDPRTRVRSMAFSPDGATLVTTSDDAPAFVWDVYGTLPSARKRGALSGDELDRVWQQLAETDAEKGFAAVRRLIADPDAAVGLIGRYLQPVELVAHERLAELLGQLGSPRFAVRERATGELRQFGDAVTGWLREQIESAESAEVRRRLEALLADAEAVTPERLSQVRAVEVLGQIGTPAAEGLLTRLAGGAPSARLTREAKWELERTLVSQE